MPEIFFKAKRSDTGDWVEGNDILHSVYPEKVFLGSEEGCWSCKSDSLCLYAGKKILQNQVTVDKATEPVKVWQDDLIAIYTVYHDDDDKPIRNKIAVVRVKFDETYQIMYAQCVYGTMQEVANECNIEYMDGSQDWPFTFWLEYMESSRSQWWEWEIIGNIHDKED